MFILILGSVTCECFPDSEISSSSYYQEFNFNKSAVLKNSKEIKFLFDTIQDVKISFKISFDINLKYINIADVTSISKYKFQSELYQALKPTLCEKRYLKSLFDFIIYTF
jgi:hypothetical protein